jgi:hypothetical protein
MKKENPSQKAERLWFQSKVQILEQGENWVIARVQGDHDSYLVKLQNELASCQCPWFVFKGHIKPCSHISALREELNSTFGLVA